MFVLSKSVMQRPTLLYNYVKMDQIGKNSDFRSWKNNFILIKFLLMDKTCLANDIKPTDVHLTKWQKTEKMRKSSSFRRWKQEIFSIFLLLNDSNKSHYCILVFCWYDTTVTPPPPHLHSCSQGEWECDVMKTCQIFKYVQEENNIIIGFLK